MKMTNKLALGVALCVALIVTLGCLGCTTFGDKSAKVLASSAATVDSAMKGWATYVVLTKPPPEAEAKVKAAYVKYQSAMSAAQSAWFAVQANGDKTAWQQAESALLAAQFDLLALVKK